MHSEIEDRCARCKATLTASRMSWFNLDQLCLKCVDDERRAPGYKRAREVELEQVRQKNYNYPGIGLAPEDKAFLAERLIGRAPWLKPRPGAPNSPTSPPSTQPSDAP